MKPSREAEKNKFNGEVNSKTEWATTAVHLPKKTLSLLKRVAFRRSMVHGGRMSVSRLVTDLVESRRMELEEEIEP